MSEIAFLPGWGTRASVFDVLRTELSTRNIATPSLDRRIVVGWSLGAQRALERALMVPQEITHLVLIAATPCFVTREDWPHGIDCAVFDEFSRSLERDVSGTIDRFVSLQAQGDADAKRVIRALRRAQSDADRGSLQADLRVLRETDLRSALHKITCRALVIHGENDALVPRAAAEYLTQALPNARCEILGGIAHAPFVSDASRVAQLIADWSR